MDSSLLKRGIGDLQRSLERFENYNDGFILPDTYLIVRLDAHRYGDWSHVPKEEYPTGSKLTPIFHHTAASLMTSSMRVVMAYSHGDEISLFIDPVENNNPIRRSRVISVFSSAASVHFGEHSGLEATFEARLAELPSLNRVIEYFYWQRRYCFRNAITIALRRAMRAKGWGDDAVEKAIQGVSEEERLAKLQELGAPIESIPHTTRRGALFYWIDDSREGKTAYRLRSNLELPDSDGDYLDAITRLVKGGSGTPPGTKGVTAPAQTARPSSPPPPSSKPVGGGPRNNKKSNTSVFKI